MIFIGWVLRILAIMDFVAAAMILSGFYNIFGIEFIIAGKLLLLGISSMFADALSRVYGILDIAAGLIIIFSVVLFPLNMIIALFLVYKGIISML
ncbi:MAG: hypothetical protein HZB65_03655 [Candidatus Aenigmarchaeota archaeon]|nr:hypothetical protein [Candidatus Aenigmarchaeota archaeon]